MSGVQSRLMDVAQPLASALAGAVLATESRDPSVAADGLIAVLLADEEVTVTLLTLFPVLRRGVKDFLADDDLIRSILRR